MNVCKRVCQVLTFLKILQIIHSIRTFKNEGINNEYSSINIK